MYGVIGINFVDHSLIQGAPAGHESAETPIGHESAGLRQGEKGVVVVFEDIQDGKMGLIET